ncbi:macro domain-containing protein [Nitrosomonas sp. Nm33]|uniref:macro domain-containing protein n=1 Tax=Nitrosomonas sp. Nm33 TaxID=133724 RepID=UPI0008980804|nr:macro domain-containing protein [Nitrosomonas sp. Nm33]SDX87336.1 O-acetyl-ADP-ribose deacetylase (regulator of RNase III), contains Macro domain [Nitrosomonas sp. Nm33]
MVEFVSGDFFEFDADIMINTVNCVGVMGAGVALAFKKRFPEMFDDYVEKCRSGVVRPGAPSVWIQKDIISKEIEIVNFPTKDHWKNPSEYYYIDDGLKWLSTYLDDKDGKVVTLPALGCGHGGLDWDRVRTMIINRLQDSPAHIYVFEPNDSVKAGHMKAESADYERLLSSVGAGVVKSISDEYPQNLRKYTKKDLYFYPKDKKNFRYDYSLICSSKPTRQEVEAVRRFIDFCFLEKRSVLLGGTVFEKKLAFEFSAKGLVCGCVLPSGIYESVKKVSFVRREGKPNLLSIGNPVVAFDKKEFMPSVFARIHLSRKAVFFASKLAWLAKFKSQFARLSLDAYYYASQDSSPEDVAAVSDIGAEKFDFEFQLQKLFLDLEHKD